MQGEPDRIVVLIRKYRMQDLQPDERKELEEWLKDENHRRIFQRLIDPEREQVFLSELRGYDTTAAFRNFDRRIRQRQRSLHFYLRIAALFILPLVVGALFYTWGDQIGERKKIKKMQELTVAGKKAILTLTDGTQLPVGGTEKSEVIADANVRLRLDSAGLVYEQKTTGEELKMNEIYVPQRGEFLLVLSDGTKVYLNADTRLVYPVVFGTDKREVFVKGEAYFEVSRDTARQFIVKTEGLDIRVLGTSFNINAYPEAGYPTATLTSGKIQACCEGEEYTLEAGQQIRRNPLTGQIEVENVNTELYTCWKDGYYYFEACHLEDIMNTLSRWYSFQVFFQEDDLKEILYSGYLKRYDDVERLFRKFEQTRDICFVREGNTVIIQKRM